LHVLQTRPTVYFDPRMKAFSIGLVDPGFELWFYRLSKRTLPRDHAATPPVDISTRRATAGV